jgi:hypothetical protein
VSQLPACRDESSEERLRCRVVPSGLIDEDDLDRRGLLPEETFKRRPQWRIAAVANDH